MILYLIETIAAFLVAILLLVSLHELGHLVAARLCGIKVLRFSVGFGKPFWSKRWRNIEWSLAPLPLGGYVKMVDTREGNVSAADLPYAFDKQSPLKRIIVVAAGPLTNLVLAALLYAVSFSVGGVREIQPYVGMLKTPSIAANAGFQVGDRILTVNGVTVNNFTEAQTQIILNLEAGEVAVEVEAANGAHVRRLIHAKGTPEAEAIAQQKETLGFEPFKISEVIGLVIPNSPAERAGLQKGDRIIAVNGMKTPHWQDWSKIVHDNAGSNLHIVYERAGKQLKTTLLTDSYELPDRSQIIGRAGVVAGVDTAWQQKIIRMRQPSFVSALALGGHKVVQYSITNLQFFGKLLIGHASLNHISGPLTIAEIAGQTAKMGWQAYLEFLALVSISLGIMNLLPIPVLDGGHLIFYTIELIRRKPLSERVQNLGLRFGLSVMLMMMLLAFFNDINRLFG